MITKIFRFFINKTFSFVAPYLNLIPFWDEIVIKNCQITQTKKTLFGRLINNLFWKEYYTRPVEKRFNIQKQLMGGISGSEWAKYYDQDRENFPPKDGQYKLGILEFKEAVQGLRFVEELIINNPKEFAVIQLGASSGKEICYLAKRFQETSFIYTDIFEAVTSYASSKLKLPNIDYVTCPAESLPAIAQTINRKRIIIFSSGSCQYVYPENLDYTFRLFSKVVNKEINFILDESCNKSKVNPMTYPGSLPRGLFSYTHNYRFYAEKNGFSTKKWTFVEPFLPKEEFPNYLQDTIKVFGWFKNFN